MFLASGRLPLDKSTIHLFAGVKETRYESGLFDQCLSSGNSQKNIKGRYCSVFIRARPVNSFLESRSKNHRKLFTEKLVSNVSRAAVSMEIPNPESFFDPMKKADIIVGLCLPSSCSAQDVRHSVANQIGRNYFTLSLSMGKSDVGNQSKPYSFVTATHEMFCHDGLRIQDPPSPDGISTAFKYLLTIISSRYLPTKCLLVVVV